MKKVFEYLEANDFTRSEAATIIITVKKYAMSKEHARRLFRTLVKFWDGEKEHLMALVESVKV